MRAKKQPPYRLPPPVEQPQKPLNKAAFIAIFGLTVACAATLVVLTLRGVPTEEFGYAPHLLIGLVVAIFFVASLANTEIIPWKSRSMRDWSRPKVLGTFVLHIMGGVTLAAGLTPIFISPAATEETVRGLRHDLVVGGITRGPASLVERHIAGTWGEPGCQVTYDLALDMSHDNKALLTIESRKSVAGQNPLRMELEALPGMSDRLVTSVLSPQSERGDQHEFVYERVGKRDFLTWAMKKREISLKLDRCREG